jgi:hypothetical protein
MNDIEKNLKDLRKLAGIEDEKAVSPVTGEIGTNKAEYMRKNNIKPGTDEWFKLWFSRTGLTGENPTPKK